MAVTLLNEAARGECDPPPVLDACPGVRAPSLIADTRRNPDVRLQTRARRCHRVRDRDRRARPGGWRTALPGGGHRGPGRAGLLRPRLGPAGGQRVHARAAAEPYPIPVRSGDIPVAVQSPLAIVVPVKGMRPLLD